MENNRKCNQCQNSNCFAKKIPDDIIERFKDYYLRELTILYHLRELQLKADKYIAEDQKPFQKPEFLKELADLHILLNLMKLHDPQFKTLTETRLQKFQSHIRKNTETVTVTFSRLTLENEKEFYDLCNNLSRNKFVSLQDFLIKIDRLLYQNNKHAVIFIHNSQICISIVDSNTDIVNQAYDLIGDKIGDIINID